MSLCPWSPACAPGLGLGSLRFLHLQLEFTELADRWMRFLGPRFIRSCSPSAVPNLIFSEHFTSRISHFSMQTLLSHNLTFSRYRGLFDLSFLFSYFSFTQPSPLVFKSGDILLGFLGSGLSNVCLLLWLFLLPELSEFSMPSLQGNHTPSQQAWS